MLQTIAATGYYLADKIIIKFNSNAIAVAKITVMTIKVPLPGLTDQSHSNMADKLPKNRNPFQTVANWTPDMMKEIGIVLTDVTETTSDFTRKKNPKNRYWRGNITFKYKEYESRILKMAGCGVPYTKSTNYGTDYVYASLQKSVSDAIIAACMKKDIIVTTDDPKFTSGPNEWWATINGLKDKVGTVTADGEFSPKDLSAILKKTELGVRINFDLVFSIRLTVTDEQDRKPQQAFRIVPDCSRASIKSIREEIEPPSIESSIPQQPAAKVDVASQELLDAIDALTM